MKERIFFLWFVCLLVSDVVMAQTPDQWRDSLRVLNEQIQRYPASTDLHLKKAAVNIELYQWEYALEEYSRVLEIDPKSLAGLYYRAYVHMNLRRYDQAKQDYERFLALMPKHFEAQLGLAMAYRMMGRKTDAMDSYNQLVQLFPDSVYAFVARASYEAEQQFYDIALFDWDEAIRLAPRNADLVVSKVDLLLSLKRYYEARNALHDAIARGIPRAALREWLDRVSYER